MSGRHVVVVGASVAGLGAAWQLSRRGFEVTVLEREQRAGGRVETVWEDGYSLDLGNPLLSTGDRRLLSWIEELGLRDEMLPMRPVLTAQVNRGHVSEIDTRSQFGPFRTPGVAKLEALRWMRLPRLIARYGSAIAPATPECGAALDDRSLSDFGRLYFGKTVLMRWMAPLVTGTTFGDATETSRVLFLRRFRQERGQRLALPRAGLEEVVAAAAERLGTRFGVEVKRIEGKRGAPVRLTLAERRPGVDRDLTRECDAVLVATSAADARRLAAPVLEPAERDVLGRMRTTASVALFLRLRRPFHSHCKLIRLPHDEGSPIESVLLEPGARGGRVPEGRGLATIRATGAFGAESVGLSDDVLEKTLLDAFEAFQSGARNAIESTRLFRVESAASQFGVGHFREIARLERVLDDVHRQGRRVYFAGDYLMGPTWEDALASGHRAAERVAAA